MTETERGTDRAGRRSKRFLPPSQRYEIWLQLVRQEVTIAEAAATEHVDRSTIMRIRTVAKEGALTALAESKPGVKARDRDWELELAKAEVARLSETVKEMAVQLMRVEGKGLSRQIRGSCSARKYWPAPAEVEHGESDQRLWRAEAERDAGDEPDLGVGRYLELWGGSAR